MTKSQFWKSVREAVKIVATWPQWKKAGVIAYREKEKKKISDKTK